MNEGVTTKICNKRDECTHPNGPELPLWEFNRRSASPDGHTYTCKECEKKAARESYHRRKQKGKLKMSKEEHEKRKQYYRDYYQDNKDKKRAYDKEYQQTPAGKKAMKKGHAKRRRKLKKQAGEPYERYEVVQRDSVDGVLQCQMCGEIIDRVRDVHIDHIIPISQGGSDELDNVRCVCASCNLSRPKDGSDVNG